jgi:hypothetical protein
VVAVLTVQNRKGIEKKAFARWQWGFYLWYPATWRRFYWRSGLYSELITRKTVLCCEIIGIRPKNQKRLSEPAKKMRGG